jgi:hypothetical protein
MAQDRTRLIVRKVLDRCKARYTLAGAGATDRNAVLDDFMAELDYALELSGVPKIAGRKPKSKPPKPEVK